MIQFYGIYPLSRYERILSSLRLDPEQLAQYPSQITPDTKAYVGSFLHQDEQGKLMPIFRQLGSVEHIYNAEGKEIPTWILRRRGFKDVDEFEEALKQANIWKNVTSDTRSMIRSDVFSESIHTNPQSGTVRVGLLDGYDTGYSLVATTNQRFSRGPELGLEELFPTDAIYQRLQDLNQKINTYYTVVTPRMSDSYGHLNFFLLGRSRGGLWLVGDRDLPGNQWHPENQLAFAFPQVEAKTA